MKESLGAEIGVDGVYPCTRAARCRHNRGPSIDSQISISPLVQQYRSRAIFIQLLPHAFAFLFVYAMWLLLRIMAICPHRSTGVGYGPSKSDVYTPLLRDNQ